MKFNHIKIRALFTINKGLIKLMMSNSLFLKSLQLDLSQIINLINKMLPLVLPKTPQK
jgi:hypothetical protein